MTSVDMRASGGGIECRSPVLVASGTFGYAQEFAALTDLSMLGGIATKGISPKPRLGNAIPRICETAAGMINSIGLENVGVEAFLRDKMPFLARTGTNVIVNFFGETFDTYVECAAALTEGARRFRAEGGGTGIHALEMNISCPNIKRGGVEFGRDPKVAGDLVRECRRVTDLPLWVKLTPNVTDVVALARGCVENGADCLSIINTVSAMGIDARTRRPRIATTFGGLSGPAIKPVALRMVYEVHRAGLGVPISGMGGIATGEDAAEFLVAGATTVQVGTLNFTDPDRANRVRRELEAFLEEQGLSSPTELVGTLRPFDD